MRMTNLHFLYTLITFKILKKYHLERENDQFKNLSIKFLKPYLKLYKNILRISPFLSLKRIL